PHTPFSWSLWKGLLFPQIIHAIMGPKADAEDWPSGIGAVDGRLYWNLNVTAGVMTPPILIAATRGVDAEVAALLQEKLRTRELAPIAMPWRLRLAAVPGYARMTWHLLRHSTPKQAWKSLHDSEKEVESFRRTELDGLADESVLAMARYFIAENIPR